MSQPVANALRDPFGFAAGEICAASTNLGRCGRRFLRYPNRRVATIAWAANRRHSRRGHVGNPITNEAHLIIEDIGKHHAPLLEEGPREDQKHNCRRA